METNEKLQQNCITSDKSLVFLQKLLSTLTTISIIVFIIIGIVLMVISESTDEESLSWYGLAIALLGTIVTVIYKWINRALLWVLFDIKVIRTSCTGGHFSQELIDFTSDSSQQETPTTNQETHTVDQETPSIDIENAETTVDTHGNM